MPPRPPKSVVTPSVRPQPPKAPTPPRAPRAPTAVPAPSKTPVAVAVEADNRQKGIRKHRAKAKQAKQPKKLYGDYKPTYDVLDLHGLSRDKFDKICRCLDALMSVPDIAAYCQVSPSLIRMVQNRSLHKPKRTNVDVDFSLPTGQFWRKDMLVRCGDDGLPIDFSELPQGLTRPLPNVDPVKLLQRLASLSKAELQHIVDFETIDGRGLPVHVLMFAQLLLDCSSYDSKTRHSAVKIISDRMHGSAVQRLANADGSNIDPFQSLVNPTAAKWKPVQIDAEVS